MISIILPTYNSITFLEERLATILNQALEDWECIVIDGFSTDGTWEYLLEKTQKDTRFTLYQYPPKGPYDAWNKGIENSKGECIYIATSDDTMSDNCLENLFKALERNPDCDLAHCCLTIIDENGYQINNMNWDKFPSQKFYGDLIQQPHIRIAPLDGLLYCTHQTVYHSFTQLLIRKKLFEEIGYFRTDVGAIADFEWGMKAGLMTNTIHIPEYLATWRFHGFQETSLKYFNSWQHKTDVLELVENAIKSNKGLKYKSILKNLYLCKLWYQKEAFELGHQESSFFNKLLLKLKLFLFDQTLSDRTIYLNFVLKKVGITQQKFVNIDESS